MGGWRDLVMAREETLTALYGWDFYQYFIEKWLTAKQ